MVIDFVTLGNCFLCPFLVFQMNVFLDDLDVSLSILRCLSFELLQRFVIFCFNLPFHFSKLNLIVVFSLSDDVLLLTASSVPFHEFKLVNDFLLLELVHRIKVLLELINFDLTVFELARSFVSQICYALLHMCNGLGL